MKWKVLLVVAVLAIWLGAITTTWGFTNFTRATIIKVDIIREYLIIRKLNNTEDKIRISPAVGISLVEFEGYLDENISELAKTIRPCPRKAITIKDIWIGDYVVATGWPDGADRYEIWIVAGPRQEKRDNEKSEDEQEFIRIVKSLPDTICEQFEHLEILNLEVESFLSSFPESPMVPDIQLLLSWQKYRAIMEGVEGNGEKELVKKVLEICQEIIDKYSEAKLNPLVIELWDKIPYLSLEWIYGNQIMFWESWYPETLCFEETTVAQDIQQIPCSVLAHFFKAKLYEYEYRVECFKKKYRDIYLSPEYSQYLPRFGGAEFFDYSEERLSEFLEKTTEEYRTIVERYPDLARVIDAAEYNLGLFLILHTEGNKSHTEGLSVWEGLAKKIAERELEGLREKVTNLMILQEMYHTLKSGAELEWLKESIMEMTSPNEYFLWGIIDDRTPWPQTFDHPIITVMIDEASVPENMVSLIFEVLEEWEIASEKRVQFRFLSSSCQTAGKPDIFVEAKDTSRLSSSVVITFTGDPAAVPSPPPPPPAAITKLHVWPLHNSRSKQSRYQTIRSAKIIIHPDSFELSAETFRGVALHEIGHALGIVNHSYENQDVMYRCNNMYSPSSLSQRDINTIRLLYNYRGFHPGYTANVKPDGQVDLQDLMMVIREFGGKIPAGHNNPNPDVNRDGIVDILDVILVAKHLGESYGTAAPAKDDWQISPEDMARLQEIHQILETLPQDEDIRRAVDVINQLIALAGNYPPATALLQNYPNPFNPETWIPYQLAEDVEVRIKIFGSNGQLIRTLNIGRQSAGAYLSKEKAAHWDGRNDAGEFAASGVYFYTFKANEFTATKKMIIAR